MNLLRFIKFRNSKSSVKLRQNAVSRNDTLDFKLSISNSEFLEKWLDKLSIENITILIIGWEELLNLPYCMKSKILIRILNISIITSAKV